MHQLKRTQKSKDGQEVKHHYHFRCTITYRFCGKKREYEDESHIKRRESEKLKKAEEERRNTAGMGGGAERRGQTLEVLRVRATLEDEGPELPPLLEEEHPTTHLRVSSRLRNGQPLHPQHWWRQQEQRQCQEAPPK